MAAFDSETILKSHTKSPQKDGVPKVVRKRNAAQNSDRKNVVGFFRKSISDALYHRQYVVLIPFALIFGISIYAQVAIEPSIWASLAVLIILSAITVWRIKRQQSWRLLGLVLAVWAGFCLISGAAQIHGTKLVSYPFAVQNLSGEIVARSNNSAGQLRLVIAKLGGDSKLEGVAKLRLTIKPEHMPEQSEPGIGDRVTVRGRILPLPKPVYPNSYDSQFHGFFDGIGGYASSLETMRVAPSSDISLFRSADQLRWTIGDRLAVHLSQQQEGIARALIIGDQSGIEDTLRENIANAGLAHVLAISGLHLTLVVGSVFFLFRGIAVQLANRDKLIKPIAAVGAMGIAVGYLMISGGNLATQRATLMLLLAFAAILVGRRAITMRNVALAAIVMIFLFPHEVFKPGFQLSFAAVVGLVAVYAFLGRSTLQLNFLARLFGGLALTSLIAGLVTAPIAAAHFQQFAPLGLIGNLIVVPIVGFFVLPAGLAAVLLMPVGLEGPFLFGMGVGIDFIVRIANEISLLSAEYTQTPMLATWVLPASGAALAWLAFFRGWAKFVMPAVFAVALLIFGKAALPVFVISDSTQAVIVREADDYVQLGRKSKSFTTRAWAERFGPSLLASDVLGQCDKHGCSALIDDRLISVVKDSVALHEECSRADLLIVRQRRDVSCPNALVITQRQLDDRGVATIYENDDGTYHVRWAINDPLRPWRP